MPRIITLTMNPALDLAAEVERLEPSHKLRCEVPVWHPGGGGINVARVLHRLGHEVMAVFPVGGSTGDRVCRLLSDEGVPTACVAIAGETRESFHVIERSTRHEFRFVLPGPTLSAHDVERVLERIQSLAVDIGCIVISGSLPPGVPPEFLARLCTWANSQGLPVALDSSGPPLRMALEAGVWLVKPSLRELSELTGRALDDIRSQAAAAHDIVTTGQARMVALSLGSGGALLVTEDGCWRAPAIPVDVAGTVGAGDSLLSGLLSGLLRGEDPPAALRRAMAAAAAALRTSGTTLCQPGQIEELLGQARIEPFAP